MMAQSKLKKFILVLAASATIALASCDDIEARMTGDQEDAPILVDSNNNKVDIYHNEMKEIYDALVTSGDTNSEKVLNNILLIIAESKFGSFYQSGDFQGLYALATSGSDADILQFTATHEVYKGEDDAHTIANVKDFTNSLIATIQKSFWSTVKNSSYQERNYFIENLFYKAEKAELYDFSKLDQGKIDAIAAKRVAIDGADSYENVDKYFAEDWIHSYQDYIQRSILQSAYRKGLVENYLMSNNYGVLGRSYARKVQYIAIKDENNGDHLGSLYRLYHAYATEILQKSNEQIGTDASVTVSEELGEALRDLHFLDKLYLGYFTEQGSDAWKVAQHVYSVAGFTYDGATVSNADGEAISKPFYKETKYGKLILDYRKQASNRWVANESTTDFTSSNAYTKETGLQIETDSIVASTNVTQGWYTSSGLSDLASDFKTRLFKMNVANELDTEADYDALTGRDDGSYTTRLKTDGKYYLMPETYDDSAAEATPYVLYDSSSTTWYIIRIDEAVKANKLVKGGDNYYDKLDASYRAGSQTANQIALEIAGLLGDSDTYKKAANQHYVEEAAISFHDQDVYDYFEKTFPDLFD